MNLTKIGRIGKTHGVRGELKISIEDRYMEDAFSAQSIIMKLGGQPLPYFIERLRGETTLLLKLEGIDDKETASALHFLDVFLPSSSITSASDPKTTKDIFLSWRGYAIIDETLGQIGVIDYVHELPEHYLAEVSNNSKTAVIPLHQDLVISVNNEKKEVVMALPEGILRVNE